MDKYPHLEENSGRIDIEMEELELSESRLDPLQFEGESVLELLIPLGGSLPLHALLLLVQIGLHTLEPVQRVRLLPLVWRNIYIKKYKEDIC